MILLFREIQQHFHYLARTHTHITTTEKKKTENYINSENLKIKTTQKENQ
jgi:hypothetical protein